ncbi:hypothetical protein T310_5286 [Rasamsonia emersonii CBS 393.64]|uniref:F-box domain-containing protein n=1 Tax=Rasamsonia emersonii (strain ATCC 16479 / CBS 393.64 / IMI 116815) TaxID=1408163 RepID=A0A0F4YRG2_RASE3|nr:hypothetical protein T310_5286 [Rasamsonia emersonii CBS 393.64]KKA20670.1 hypothetical protein T310_5286 [Rasamsonia emersonii CBS 393.64]
MHPSASPVLKLPVELILAILLVLPDISTLQSIVLAHSWFYLVFRENRDAIITHLLTTLVSAELLPQALAVRESSRVQSWTDDKVARVLARFRDDRRIVRLLGLSLADALAIESLHRCVCSFVDKFASAALSVHPFTERPETPSPLSVSEWRHVAGAFYRAELCTNLLRPRDGQESVLGDDSKVAFPYSGVPGVKDVLLRHFHIWEIEQLGCVGEFVYRELGRRSGGDCGISWGRSNPEHTDIVVWESQKRQFFWRGLQFLHSLFASESVTKRCVFLATKFHSSRYYLQNAAWHADSEWDNSPQNISDDTDHRVEVVFGARLNEDSGHRASGGICMGVRPPATNGRSLQSHASQFS